MLRNRSGHRSLDFQASCTCGLRSAIEWNVATPLVGSSGRRTLSRLDAAESRPDEDLLRIWPSATHANTSEEQQAATCAGSTHHISNISNRNTFVALEIAFVRSSTRNVHRRICKICEDSHRPMGQAVASTSGRPRLPRLVVRQRSHRGQNQVAASGQRKTSSA